MHMLRYFWIHVFHGTKKVATSTSCLPQRGGNDEANSNAVDEHDPEEKLEESDNTESECHSKTNSQLNNKVRKQLPMHHQ